MTLLKSFQIRSAKSGRFSRRGRRCGFTLIELLLVVAIIAIISSLGLAVLGGAEQDALENRTRAGIERIQQALDQKLEENLYRILPIRPVAGTDPVDLKDIRLRGITELMRVEFPTQIEHADPANFPRNDTGMVAGIMDFNDRSVFPEPQMLRRFDASLTGATTANQDAECLYAIMSLHYD
ncbi:MAG: type II secretion system protein, partial [Pirellulaceae bacterium]